MLHLTVIFSYCLAEEPDLIIKLKISLKAFYLNCNYEIK